MTGFEPATSAMATPRSPELSYIHLEPFPVSNRAACSYRGHVRAGVKGHGRAGRRPPSAVFYPAIRSRVRPAALRATYPGRTGRLPITSGPLCLLS
jgi:hypothetical protein